jgi:membrane dipeptidase
VPDDVLKLVTANGGLVMVNFYSGFLTPTAKQVLLRQDQFETDLRKKTTDDKEMQLAIDRWRKDNPMPPANIHDVVDHIEHIIKLAGIDHVGLGSDFDGVNSVPTQLEDVSKFPMITQELLNRGYKKEEILKILGGNLLRVMREVEKAAGK